jgi:hypothetical protein
MAPHSTLGFFRNDLTLLNPILRTPMAPKTILSLVEQLEASGIIETNPAPTANLVEVLQNSLLELFSIYFRFMLRVKTNTDFIEK